MERSERMIHRLQELVWGPWMLAALLGISLSGYTRYEHGERDPNAPTLAAMADFFQVSADYLLGRKEQRE